MNINDFGAFNAGVWGTVSDWFMVIITSGTFLLIYLTLRSQIKVQRDQQRITDIEGERFRIEYKPFFELSVQSIVNKTLDEHVKSVLHIRMNVTKKDCKNFNIIKYNTASTIESASISKEHIGQHLPIDYISIPEAYDLHFIVSSMLVLFPNEGATLIFYLEFEDLIGNRYRQEYIYTFKNEVNNVSVRNPVRILS